jgi:hypothetical protein
MPLSTEESPSDSAHNGSVIPNFREDERLQARYASMLERRIKTHFADHENSIRRNASAKRDERRDELREAQAEWNARNAVSEATRESYRAAYPQYVKKTRLIGPSVIDNMRSLGAAKKLYHAAEEAWRATEHAASEIRRIEHNEAQLEIELSKALERAPETSKDVTTSERWLNEIHAEEDMAEAKAKNDTIVAEREDYAKRLAAGTVSNEELRLRAFAAEDIKHVTLPFDGLMFLRIDHFGPNAYFIMRDLRKRMFALPYDRRLDVLMDGVYDIAKNGKEFEVRRARRENTPVPMSLLDHFNKCSDSPEAAQEAYREYQEFVKAKRAIATMTEADELEASVIALLAAVAAEKTR